MTKVSIVIQSHLSEAAIDIAHNPYMASRRIKFVKLLISKYPDTSVLVDDDEIEVLFYEM